MDTATTSPPPAPDLAPSGPTDPIRGGTPRSRAELGVVLRERLPELLATTGAALLVAAVAGSVVSRWTALDDLGQAGLLVAGSVVLTLQGSWSARRGGRLVTRLVPLSWASAAALTVVAAQLVFAVVLPDFDRVAIAGAGLVAAGHAGWLWRRRPSSVVLQLATVAGALYAVGPVGRSLADGWDVVDPGWWVGAPLAAVFGSGAVTSDGFGVVAVGHLAVAVAWSVVAFRLDTVAGRVGRVGGALLLAWSALELNAMASPIGASLALLVVLGFLLVGIAVEDALLIGFGAMAGLVTGLRTTWSLFTGEVAVTVTVATAGVLLVLVALRLGRARDDHDRTASRPGSDEGHGARADHGHVADPDAGSGLEARVGTC